MAKALILVGGYGTRLRPLTLSCPKPIVEFANKPMVIHQIEALKDAGVEEVILAINYRPEAMLSFTQEWSKKLGITISISRETEPMGTAGPLALAREKLAGDKAFFVLNSDVICDYPLKDMLAFHEKSGAEATMLVTKVEDPSKYGVVIHDAAGKIDRFVEKPKEFVGDEINAGIYLLSPSVLDRIELRPTSIEREVFPSIAADGKLFAFLLPGFWMDVGQPKDFLKGLALYLDSLRKKSADKLAAGKGIKGNVLVDETAKVGENCLLGPDVCIGPGAVVGDGVRLSNCVIMRGVVVKNFAKVDKSIIGWESVLGSWSRVENFSVLGEDVTVRDEVFATGAVVLPHKEVKENVEKPQIIL